MERHKTISEIKLSFIREQIRILTSPLRPNSDWRDYGPEVEDDLPEKVVEDVLQKRMRDDPKKPFLCLYPEELIDLTFGLMVANSEPGLPPAQPGCIFNPGHAPCCPAD
jgi:hypothetical protein